MTIARLLSRFSQYWTISATWALAHKVWSVVILAAVLGGGYYAYTSLTASTGTPRYVVSEIASGTVVATLTESGQVSATSQVNINAKSSGVVLSVLVAPGQHVRAGTALAYLDSTDAQKTVRDAQSSLQSAQISLAKLTEPADALSLTQAENSVASAQADVAKAHTEGYNDVAAAFLDLPTVITGLDTVLHGSTVPGRTSQQNESAYMDIASVYNPLVGSYESAAESAFKQAKASYDKTLAEFKATPRDASDAELEQLVKDSYSAAADLSDALKASTNFLNFVNTTLTDRNLNVPTTLAGHINSLTTYTGTTNQHVATLSSDASGVSSAERALAAAKASFDKTKQGADALDVQSSTLSLKQRQDALDDANRALADTVVRAPFDGVIASIAVQRYQTINSGSAVALMVSDHQTANLSLNEVDAAKLSVGQKAKLTFDAVPDLSIEGTVSSVNAIGTVSQGVVTYDATITFDTDNSEIRAGMSVDADIATASASGLRVPASAIKTVGGKSFVQVFDPPLAAAGPTGVTTTQVPTMVPVTLGLESDTEVVIESGLTEGEQIVIRTILGTTAVTTPTTTTGTRSTSGATTNRSFGGTGVRVQ